MTSKSLNSIKSTLIRNSRLKALLLVGLISILFGYGANALWFDYHYTGVISVYSEIFELPFSLERKYDFANGGHDKAKIIDFLTIYLVVYGLAIAAFALSLLTKIKLVIRNNAKIIKFLAVGILNTIFGYSVYALIAWLGYHYSIAAGGSTILGVLFNFKSTGVLVFESRDNSRIIPFLMVYSVVYGLNVAGLAFLTSVGLNSYVSGIILILPLALVAYYLNSKYVFQ